MTLYFIPLFAAFTGWIVNWLTIRILIQYIFPKQRQQIIQKLAAEIATEFAQMRSKLTDPENIKSIVPVVDAYMDNFLREKLPEAMPVFKMFIGASTTDQVKAVLMKEVDNMLPEMIEQYLKNNEPDFEKIIEQKLTQDKLASFISQFSGTIQLAGAAIGFIIGLAELFILLSGHSS